MAIEICKWKHNADSPVMLMIDDLANVWVDANKSGRLEIGDDWGFAGRGEGSSILFLENEVLRLFPKVKVNFYVPVGERAGMILDSNIYMYSKPIDEDIESKKFFKSLHENPRYELSYHGLTHGTASNQETPFKQEWECYSSLDIALQTIEKGKQIFKNTTGEYPSGGKYCGYKSGSFGDDSIDHSGFTWWHRYWNKGLEQGEREAEVGNELDLIKSYDLTTFGSNQVVDIPSTLPGNLYNNFSHSPYKQFVKNALGFIHNKKRTKDIDFLLGNKLVISIQEHISPARNDGKIQHPNIFTDKDSLVRIFKYLEDKNVWYCTGSELAKYYLCRIGTSFSSNDGCQFSFIMDDELTEKYNRVELSIKVPGDYSSIIQPNGTEVFIENSIATLEIMTGMYKCTQ